VIGVDEPLIVGEDGTGDRLVLARPEGLGEEGAVDAVLLLDDREIVGQVGVGPVVGPEADEARLDGAGEVLIVGDVGALGGRGLDQGLPDDVVGRGIPWLA